MIDTHAHLHDPAFDADRAETLARARAAGLRTLVTIGTDLADSRRAVETANALGVAVAIGVHPHETVDAPDDLEAALIALAGEARRLVAVGEIGLDFHYDHSPRDVQRDALRRQLAVAERLGLPVVFHEREAYDAFVEALREETARRRAADAPPLRGVVHCFTRDAAAARVYTGEFGLALGIGGVATFKNAAPLREAIAAVGIAPLVLETDCPYLAPVPHRGKRNEPAFAYESARTIADVLNLPLEETLARLTENARRLFGLDPADDLA